MATVYDRTTPGSVYPDRNGGGGEVGPSHKQTMRVTPFAVRTVTREETGADGEVHKVKRFRWSRGEAWIREPQAKKLRKLDSVAAQKSEPRPLVIRRAGKVVARVWTTR